MSNFTPGPWRIEPTAISLIITGANGKEICELNHPYPVVRDPETLEPYDNSCFKVQAPEYDVNARLIVSAPEMKGLLWDAWQDLNALSNGDQSCDARYEATETMEKIMSLLRRIEGEEEPE